MLTLKRDTAQEPVKDWYGQYLIIKVPLKGDGTKLCRTYKVKILWKTCPFVFPDFFFGIVRIFWFFCTKLEWKCDGARFIEENLILDFLVQKGPERGFSSFMLNWRAEFFSFFG